ncbi:MAG: ethanolamine ammonia-lyase reactivating factor EutA [Burkholderiales bacterium]|nr:ethanolamine ammonia-lyase reactivating factor EutA [Burkholderiales bacterium]
MTVGQRGELVESIWKVENVELTTVGIDIGSSTSHLMFASVRLQRKAQALSSQFVVVERRVLWKSPILLTPFLPDGTIDAAALGRFVAKCHADAGLAPAEVDTGAVILTGEAIKRANARAIADVFAAQAGKFVTAAAGHQLECVLAAHGSGAVAMSREQGNTILNVDIGGGTTKVALVSKGEVLSTCAFEVGARFYAHDVDALADVAIAYIRGDAAAGLARELLLTEPLVRSVEPDLVTFSGGVSEYIYGREDREFGDVAKALAARILAAFKDGRIRTPIGTPREGIRATVIGASQFTVQVSGKTIYVADDVVLPLRNVPVIAPNLHLEDLIDPAEVARSIHAAIVSASLDDEMAVAIAIRWRGDPLHARLHGLARGIAIALAPRISSAAPFVLMIDGDVGRTLGHILRDELGLARPVLSIDGIQLRNFDFVDIGEVIRPADVVPVVIKSLIFAGDSAHQPRDDVRFRPVMERNLQ